MCVIIIFNAHGFCDLIVQHLYTSFFLSRLVISNSLTLLRFTVLCSVFICFVNLLDLPSYCLTLCYTVCFTHRNFISQPPLCTKSFGGHATFVTNKGLRRCTIRGLEYDVYLLALYAGQILSINYNLKRALHQQETRLEATSV